MDQDIELSHAIQRLNERAWGIALGLMLGGGLFLATLILVLRGGPNIGAHLGLIAVYFPGYSVSFLGSLVGFIYGFVLGYGVGRVVGLVYNRVVGFTS